MPDAFELVSSVRVEEPAVALIVTEVALVVCQFSVTLCPSLMVLAVTEKTRVGAAGGDGGCGGFSPELGVEHEQSTQNAIGRIPNAVQRRQMLFIR